MKILYSVQATGNGHISRAMELLPYLKKYGTVDIFLSGANSTLILDAPIRYRSKGLSLFYTCHGSLDYWRLAKNISPFRLNRDIKSLPVEQYDLVLNDFECITSLACAFKKVSSIHFGHQASFLSEKTPRPDQRYSIGEWVLKNYAKATDSVGLHFERYDDFILPPVIKQEIQESDPKDENYVCVYLPCYCDHVLKKFLDPLKEFRFEVFSREVSSVVVDGHITFMPVSRNAFNKSLINCSGIITGAGFETPAEALYLKKKLIAIPIKGQYEQLCNAAALKRLGVITLDRLDENFTEIFMGWMNEASSPSLTFSHTTESIVEFVMNRSSANKYYAEAS